MKISIACDHGAFDLKMALIPYLKELGHEVSDFGAYSKESCHYPDYIYPACLALKRGEVDRAIVLCTTGIGVSMVANKVKGVRASLVTNVADAKTTREHYHANCLAMGAKNVSEELAKEIVKVWLETESLGGRHQIRVDKIREIEELENE